MMLCGVVTSAPLALTKLTSTLLACCGTVMLIAEEVFPKKFPSPLYCATKLYGFAAAGKRVVVMVYAPVADSRQAGGVHESTTTPVPIDLSFRSTVPVGVAAPEALVTVPANVTLAPIVDEVGPTSVTVVPMRLGDFQLASKFATFTVPSPVAKSYPADVLKAGVEPPEVVAMTPNWFAAVLVLLQFGLPPTQATELLPLV